MLSFKFVLVCVCCGSYRAEANKADAGTVRRGAKGVIDGEDVDPYGDASETFRLEASDQSYVLPTEPGTYTKILPDGRVEIANLDNDDEQGDGVHLYVGRGSGNSHNDVEIDVETSGDGTYIYVAEGDGNRNNTAKIKVRVQTPSNSTMSNTTSTSSDARNSTTNETNYVEGDVEYVDGTKGGEGINSTGEAPDMQWLDGLSDTNVPPGSFLRTYPNGTVEQANLDRDHAQGDGVHLYLSHGIGNSNNHAEVEIDTTGDGTYIYIAEGQDNQYNSAKIYIRAGVLHKSDQ